MWKLDKIMLKLVFGFQEPITKFQQCLYPMSFIWHDLSLDMFFLLGSGLRAACILGKLPVSYTSVPNVNFYKILCISANIILYTTGRFQFLMF